MKRILWWCKNDSFLERDSQIFEEKSKDKFRKRAIYVLYYPKGIDIEKYDGTISNIDENYYQMEHFCSSSPGSSGGPLFYLKNQKVIGIHKGEAKKGKEYNYGTFLKLPIEEFNEILTQNSNLNEKTYDDNSKSIARNINSHFNSNINYIMIIRIIILIMIIRKIMIIKKLMNITIMIEK